MAIVTADEFAKHLFRVLSNAAEEFYADDLTEDGVHDLDYTLEGSVITVTTTNIWSKDETQRFTVIVRG